MHSPLFFSARGASTQTQPGQRPTVLVTVRYYVSRESQELIGSETFPDIRIRFGTFTLQLGEGTDWESDLYGSLDDIFVEHSKAWVSVTIGDNDEPPTRHRVTRDKREYCNC